MSDPVTHAREILQACTGKDHSPAERARLSVILTEKLLEAACADIRPAEATVMAQLKRMMPDQPGKDFTFCMTDQCFRSSESERVADQLVYLLDHYGTPSYLNSIARAQMSLFKLIGKPLADLLIPAVKKLIRHETSRVILPGEPKRLDAHIRTRKAEGVTTNLNHLGEAILGEDEAAIRLQSYLTDLKRPAVEYVSVKISTVCSQINLLDWDGTLNILAERMRILYRAARANQFLDQRSGKMHDKFVNLDMEEYRDLQMTAALFMKVLDEDEFLSYKGGIVLQAYLPDSYGMLQELTAWSQRRMARGGAPIKVRIVKGANMAMETYEASLKDWERAPYREKLHTDASYRKMMLFATRPENAKAVNLGIASHNLFELAHALILVHERSIQNYIQFEMLEGMAEHMRRVIQKIAGGVVLYCPAAEQHEFQNAIAYLIRRLDENTAPANFLRHAFDIRPGNDTFKAQAEFFLQGCQQIDTVFTGAYRQQSRLQPPQHLASEATFHNEQDTDFALPLNRQWAAAIYQACASYKTQDIPLVIQGQELRTGTLRPGLSPNDGRSFYHCHLAEGPQIEAALAAAGAAAPAWAATSVAERAALLTKTAALLRERRAQLITVMMLDTGKTLPEADVEVSEAIDFCEFYARNMLQWAAESSLSLKPLGVVMVTPPWNFPCAIPLGGVVAALVTGNAVIFKPAPEAALTGYETIRCLYDAGLPPAAVQFVNCEDSPHGSTLVKDPRVNAIILTGATETAKLFLHMRPDLELLAETGGKNCMIITDMADRDQAIADIVQSAFGHAGQKCSACSLAILERNVYEDQHFLKGLADAARSWKCGPSTDPASRMNPLIHAPAPGSKLYRALTTLEPGEQWLLKPEVDPSNPHLWTPGIKIGVQPGSFTFTTEFFGPVLALVRAETLSHALEMANSSPYGLTSGIHSTDLREQQLWIDSIQVGNAYLNRSITGAIVRRQPFGGFKNSAFGRGFQAGGPHYLLQLMHVSEQSPASGHTNVPGPVCALRELVRELSPADLELFVASIGSYDKAHDGFMQFKDPSKIYGQHNYSKYFPIRQTIYFVRPGDCFIDVARVLAAASICSSPLKMVASAADSARLSLPRLTQAVGAELVLAEEQEAPAHFIDSSQGRVRVSSAVPTSWLRPAAETFTYLHPISVFSDGRLELLNYLRSMSISDNFHRYGNLVNAKF